MGDILPARRVARLGTRAQAWATRRDDRSSTTLLLDAVWCCLLSFDGDG